MILLIDDTRNLGADAIARTAPAGRKLLALGGWTQLCLDHDLGGTETGYDVLVWAIENTCLPDEVHLVTSDSSAYTRMKAKLEAIGYVCSGRSYFEKVISQEVSDPVHVPLEILQQGAVKVNTACLLHEAPGIACISVDLISKYVDSPAISGEDDRPPQLYLMANESTLKLDESVPRETATLVQFPTKYAGWQVFAVEGPGRYTLKVVLVAPGEKHG